MGNPAIPEDTATGGFPDEVASGEVLPESSEAAAHVPTDPDDVTAPVPPPV